MKKKAVKQTRKPKSRSNPLQPARERLDELYLAIGRAALTVEQAQKGLGTDAAANRVHADLVKQSIKAAKEADKAFREALKKAEEPGK